MSDTSATQVSGSTVTISTTSRNIWFAGRLIGPGEDRLQSIGKYFPYGEDRYNPNPANPGNDQEKFATYTRDSATLLDYASQRYYDNQLGRFMVVDPYSGSADSGNPQSWNRYAYVLNDPLELVDPTGMQSNYSGIANGGCPPGSNCPYPSGAVFNATGTACVSLWCRWFGGSGSSPAPPSQYDASNPGVGPDQAPGGQVTQIQQSGGGGQPPKTVQISTVLMPFAPKPANKQYCDSLAQKVSNLRQTLRNKAYELETNPQNLPDDVPGGKYSESQWGHLVPYINYQTALAKNEAEYNNRCGGGGGPSGFKPQVPIIAPPNFKIPTWLLFVGGAGALGIMAAPLVTAF